MDYRHHYNFDFAKSDREDMFKKGQPGDDELFSLSQELMINWRWLGEVPGLTDLTLNEIDEANGEESDKMYAVLRKWKESRGCRASYQELARLIEICSLHRFDRIEKYCYVKGK